MHHKRHTTSHDLQHSNDTSEAPRTAVAPRPAGRAARRPADGHPRHHGREHRAADGARDLDLSGSQVSWTITSYSLIFGSLLLLGGRAADLLGPPAAPPRRPRRVHAGVAHVSPGRFGGRALLAARAGTGPRRGDAVAGRSRDHHHRVPRQAARNRPRRLGAVGGAGAAIGVLVGGLLTSSATGGSSSTSTSPLAIALAVTALKVVPADARKPCWRGLDLPGRPARHGKPRVDRLRDLAGP